MTHYGVFDANSGDLLRPVKADELAQVAIQSRAANEVVLEGDFRDGGWRLVDGWPEPFNRPLPPVTIAMVKDEQARLLRYSDWAITRAADPTDGTPIPPSIIAERSAIRAGAERLEAMDPIPADYRDPKYWTSP